MFFVHLLDMKGLSNFQEHLDVKKYYIKLVHKKKMCQLTA